MKIRTVGSELFRAEGLTDGQKTTELIVAFRNYAKAQKKICYNKSFLTAIISLTTECVTHYITYVHKIRNISEVTPRILYK